jgi:hypothetical protein
MAGKWLQIVPKPCACPKPFGLKELIHGVGSRWQCDCGKIWEITKWNGGDQREGPYATWREVIARSIPNRYT